MISQVHLSPKSYYKSKLKGFCFITSWHKRNKVVFLTEIKNVSIHVSFKRFWISNFASVINHFNLLSANLIKWSNTLKKFIGCSMTNYLSVFDHFVRLTLKGLIPHLLKNLKSVNDDSENEVLIVANNTKLSIM